MQFNIVGQHLEVTEAIKEHAQNKVSKLEKHSNNITSVDVILKLEHKEHIAEGKVHIGGKDFFAIAKTDDMYASINDLFNKLEAQMTKHHDMKSSH